MDAGAGVLRLLDTPPPALHSTKALPLWAAPRRRRGDNSACRTSAVADLRQITMHPGLATTERCSAGTGRFQPTAKMRAAVVREAFLLRGRGDGAQTEPHNAHVKRRRPGSGHLITRRNADHSIFSQPPATYLPLDQQQHLVPHMDAVRPGRNSDAALTELGCARPISAHARSGRSPGEADEPMDRAGTLFVSDPRGTGSPGPCQRRQAGVDLEGCGWRRAGRGAGQSAVFLDRYMSQMLVPDQRSCRHPEPRATNAVRDHAG